MSELKTHLSQQLGDAQSKYIYFLLAISASCIALSVQRTTGHYLSWDLFPLGLAVISWGGSFFAGCRNRLYFSSTLYANLALLQVQEGNHPGVPYHPDAIAAASEGIRKAAEHNSSMANFWGKLQFRLLVLGAVFFITWHIIEMSHIKTDITKISDSQQTINKLNIR